MISNQILQNTIDGIKKISRVDLYVADTDGKVIAGTAATIDQFELAIVSFAASEADSQSVQGFQFFKIYDDNHLEYILIAQGSNEDVFLVGQMAVFQVQSLLVAYKERFDKDNYIKNLILDNMLAVDVYSRAQKLHIDTNARRCVCIIETDNEKDSLALETVRNMFTNKKKDFITAVDEKSIVLVKEVPEGKGYDDVHKTAQTIVDMLNSEAMVKARVAYGTIINEISNVSKSYKEAGMALEVGKIFFTSDNVVAYNNLGIGRLIFQLPMTLCKMFIKEIFGDNNPDDFDEETLITINKFFENNLNVSETSRQLFIHRNTLVYRLDKIEKSTGLDLRVFEDAITFKIALMVVKYMKYSDNTEN